MIARVPLRSAIAATLRRLTPMALSPTARRWNRQPLPFWARSSLAAEVLGTYLAVRLNVSRVGLPTLVRTLRGDQFPAPGHSGAAGTVQHALALRLGWVVQTVLRHAPSDAPCLVRSLVLTKLLARRHIPARLVIGVRSEPSFSAHAWVEHCGQPVLPTDAAHQRLVEL